MNPDIYYFNPTCEPAIANGSPFYTAPARLRKFEGDVGYLPCWLATESDQVLVQGTIDKSYPEKMRKLGFKLPEVLGLKQAMEDPGWITQPKGRLYPWGWSPAVYQLFKQVLPSFRDDFQHSAVSTWHPDHKVLYSRLTGIGLLTKILEMNNLPWLPLHSDLPVVCRSPGQVYLETGRHKRLFV